MARSGTKGGGGRALRGVEGRARLRKGRSSAGLGVSASWPHEGFGRAGGHEEEERVSPRLPGAGQWPWEAPWLGPSSCPASLAREAPAQEQLWGNFAGKR